MNTTPDKSFVFHGSHEKFDIAIPRRNRRGKLKDGKILTVFNEISFHATPYKWIALAYTYKGGQRYQLDDGREAYYNRGVSLLAT